MNVGCDLRSSIESYNLAKNRKNIFASVGIHPHGADKVNKKSLKTIEELAVKYKVAAIGEIGLDYFKSLIPKEKQAEVLKMQLELALNHKMPIIIHCRDAYKDLLDILEEYKTSNWKGVVHCFTANWKIAERFLSLGFYIGFTGIVTYYKSGAKSSCTPDIHNTIKNVPINRILIETDCPYLSPFPKRGMRNEPAYIKYTARKIADVRSESFEKVEKQTTKNAENLFKMGLFSPEQAEKNSPRRKLEL